MVHEQSEWSFYFQTFAHKFQSNTLQPTDLDKWSNLNIVRKNGGAVKLKRNYYKIDLDSNFFTWVPKSFLS